MTALEGRVVVVSPHLDDAVLSLGASIAGAVRAGADVTVLTVFAGVPDATDAAGEWDAAAGFATAGEATRARRDDDARACAILGARPVWLPFADATAGDDALWPSVRAALAGAEVVLLPGFPLTHPDHLSVTRLVLDHARTERDAHPARLGLYVEQPYAAWTGRRPGSAEGLRDLAPEPSWSAVRGDGGDRRRKRRAGRCYRSQLRLLTRRVPVLWKIARFEARAGGEGIAWIDRG